MILGEHRALAARVRRGYDGSVDDKVVVVRDINLIRRALGDPVRIAAEPPLFCYIWSCGCEGRTDERERTWHRCAAHERLPLERRNSRSA